MTWITTIPMSEADERLRAAFETAMGLYPSEYSRPSAVPEIAGESIVASHTLIPEALRHAFSTFGALIAPDLPLTRRQHEMIATLVSVENRCSIESNRTQSFCVMSAWTIRWSTRSVATTGPRRSTAAIR
jgi:hypothetical protein